MFGPILVMSLMSLFLLIPRHRGGYGPKGNWIYIRRPRRGLPCWIYYNTYKLYRQYLPYLQFLLAPRINPASSLGMGFLLFGLIFFCIFFWHSFRTPCLSFLVPTLLQLGRQLGPKIHPTSPQEPSQIHPKSYLVFDALLHWFFVDFWSNLSSKITPKSTHNSVQRLANKLTTKIAKCIKKLTVFL